MGVEYILKNSLLRRTLDNVTVVMIAFQNFKTAVFGSSNNGSFLNDTIDAMQVPSKIVRPSRPLQELNIEACQATSIQAPKSTTNASLVNTLTSKKTTERTNTSEVIKTAKAPMTANNVSGRPKHFDFSKA